MDCDADSLLNLDGCFGCLTWEQADAIQVYLLCQLNSDTVDLLATEDGVIMDTQAAEHLIA